MFNVIIFCLILVVMLSLVGFVSRYFRTEKDTYFDELKQLSFSQLEQRLIKLTQRRETLKHEFIKKPINQQQSIINRINDIDKKIEVINKIIAVSNKQEV